MISIVTPKEEVLKLFNNIVLMTSSRTPVLPSNTSFHGSGKVLLFMYKHTNAKDENINKWNDMLFSKVKKRAFVLKIVIISILGLRDTSQHLGIKHYMLQVHHSLQLDSMLLASQRNRRILKE